MFFTDSWNSYCIKDRIVTWNVKGLLWQMTQQQQEEASSPSLELLHDEAS